MSDFSEQAGEGKADTSRKVQARARVWRACEVCRKRKVKCNGQEPCAYCVSSGKICSFKDINDNAASARQQSNSIEIRLAKVEEMIQKLLPMAHAFETWLTNNRTAVSGLPFRVDPDSFRSNIQSPISRSPPSDDRPRSSTSYQASNAIKTLCANDIPESIFTPRDDTDAMEDNSSYGPEKWSDRYSHLSKDSYGHLRYTGGAASFMLVDALASLQNHNAIDASPESTLSVKTDIQLPFFAPNKIFRKQAALPLPEDIRYPSHELADELVATYFSKIHHTFPILHQQTFIGQYIKVMEQKAKGKPSKDHGFLSSLFAVFACGACLIEKGRPKSGQGEASEFRGFDFYEKAQLLFWMGTGSSQIEHVQCLSIMAICNATWNTLAQSWINVGGAVRRAQDLGLHLSGRHLPLTHFEREYRRRVWWCVYGLDRVLSISLGRPSGTHEDDYDVELPSELDDAQLAALRDGALPSYSIPTRKSYMTGFVALLEIYVIAGKVMRFVQSAKVEDAKSEEMHEHIMDLDSELDSWQQNLPSEVKFAANDTSNSQMFTLCLIAHFVYHSAKINLHRPFIPDRLTSSSDHTSWIRCLTAARSCIKIGEITQEMLPASHHLAFAVQYITLSAVLLLRSTAYVNQPELFSTIISDAEKAIKSLEGMESIFPASKRCKEIVSGLLAMVRIKLYGGPSAIEALQATHRRQEPPQESLSAGVKRKRLEEPSPVASSSRQRLDDREWTSTGYRTSPPSLDHNIDDERYEQQQQFSNLMRTSSIRTPMSNDVSLPPTPSDTRALLTFNNSGTQSLPPFEQLIQPPQGYAELPPHLSLDINAWSTGRNHNIDEYSGYDFLGEDLFALLGSVVKPSERPSPHTFEENAQALWQAFNGKQEAPFTT
ncbi:fungal-specific transcription factor domain-containing protein [Lentinula aciculospora]|uniref:Fungal-specific transcription factor domain-containing protein n=1 Tax=Lentinula aciculospora TaxID=153920 RepID=A0A9W9A1C2_9AGAR|nr:fungal-specific transcription factor domain-containing protein [Lentinula aciculospora]